MLLVLANLPLALMRGMRAVFGSGGGVSLCSLLERHVGGIAYAAHVGGFVFGMVFARLFEYTGGDTQAETL